MDQSLDNRRLIKSKMIFNLICYIVLRLSTAIAEESSKPNIVVIVVDDMGWDDVSFHGSDQIMTPNMDMLAYKGIILHQYYTDCLGTSSRSSFLTGKYPLRLGTQGASIKASEDRGIPISERLLPSYLQELGYATHLIGKWHVGKSRDHYLPNSRGFGSFYGFLGDAVDYLTLNRIESLGNNTTFFGLDFFENTKPISDATGYLTDMITDKAVNTIQQHDRATPLYLQVAHAAPHAGGGLVSLQPPAAAIPPNKHIAHSARWLYAGLMTSLDKSIGNIVAALAEREILNNTLIVLFSDNGAATTNFGSNLPLRGAKNTPWEGGIRAVALLWHSLLTPSIYEGLFHVTDWLPTLVAVAGGNVSKVIDGFNQWEAIVRNDKSRRYDALLTIDDLNGWAAFREGEFKLIVGDIDRDRSSFQGMEIKAMKSDPPSYENVLLESETYRVFNETLDVKLDINEVFKKRNKSNLLMQYTNGSMPNYEFCTPTKAKGCLFNVSGDPLEVNDLWHSAPDIVKRMTLRLRTLWTELKPRRKPQYDLRANPGLREYVWLPWVENDAITLPPNDTLPTFPLQVSLDEFAYLVNLNLNSFKEKMTQSLKSMGDSFVKSVGGLLI